MKEKDNNYIIDWNIAIKSQKYVCGSRRCDLCICEKLLISRADPNVLLNKCDKLACLGINIVENHLMIGDMKHTHTNLPVNATVRVPHPWNRGYTSRYNGS